MKTRKLSFLFFTIALLLFSCNTDEPGTGYISVTVKATTSVEGVSTDGLKIVLVNASEGIHIEETITGETRIGGIIPGIYDITVSGQAEDEYGKVYNLGGSLSQRSLATDGEVLEIEVEGVSFSPLVFSEIFYVGSRYTNASGGIANYFRNQYYEIYNNSELTVYLDGVHFANIAPNGITSASSTLPTWPEEDGDNYVYAERIWKIPGNGTAYPLAPGEAVVISQFAANHTLDIYAPGTNVDCSGSEFEFNMNNQNFPDQPADDMIHVFYDGSAEFGTIPQYLVSVFGGAYVIFKVPEGETYDPVNNADLKTTDLGSTNTRLYGKIPRSYVLDAVEAVRNESLAQRKRIPASLDAGATYIGDTYVEESVARKKIGENADGTPILQDTNNSTDDFDRNLTPAFRRYGSKVPSWNETLN